MPVCPGLKRDGGRCTVVVSGPNDYCYQHDPARAEERRHNARRAARSKPNREIVSLKAYLEDLAEEVRSGNLDPKIGAVVNQITNTRLRALELERQLRETDELAAEVEQLREAYGIS